MRCTFPLLHCPQLKSLKTPKYDFLTLTSYSLPPTKKGKLTDETTKWRESSWELSDVIDELPGIFSCIRFITT